MYKRKENGDPTEYFHTENEGCKIILDSDSEDKPVWIMEKNDNYYYYANQCEDEPNFPPDFGNYNIDSRLLLHLSLCFQTLPHVFGN